MTISSIVPTEWSGIDPKTSSPGYLAQPTDFPPFLLRWSVFINSGSDIEDPVAFGQGDFLALVRWGAEVQKLERRNQERLAAVYLDPTARQLLNALDRRTSIRWEDLPDVIEGEPSDVLKSVGILAGANLCEISPTRLRLSEYGDKLLAESSTVEPPGSAA